MLSEEIYRIWTTLKPKLIKQKSYLEVYQKSDFLSVKLSVQNKPLVLELLSKHKLFTFLNLRLDKEILNSGELDLTSLPAIYRLSIINPIKKDFKIYCKVKEASGNYGFGFKKIEESGQWTGVVSSCETLYVFDKNKVSNKASRGETWNGIAPVVDEIVFKS